MGPDTSRLPAEQSPCVSTELQRDQLSSNPMRKANLAKPTRKEFLKLGLAGGTALALPFGVSGCSSGNQTGALLRSSATLPEPFSVPLPVPPVLEPVRTDANTD